VELNSPNCNTEAEGGMWNEARKKKNATEKKEETFIPPPHPSG
jgi:hypothetical protein